MKNNYSSKDIIDFIRENKDTLKEEDIKFLLYYYRELNKDRNISGECNLEIILEDTKKVKEYMDSINNSEIVKERYNDLDTILEKIEKKEDINKISYLLDRLYYENNLPVREHSNLIFQLKKIKEKDNKNERK